LATPTIPVAVAAPVAPAPAVDLLDMGAWDVTPSTTTVPTATNFGDAFAPQPIEAGISSMVETVSGDDDDDDDLPVTDASTTTTSISAPPPPTATIDDDPFASAGLFGNVPSEKPLPTFERTMMTNKFEYNGIPMAPMPIITSQFGQQWGSCAATSPISINSTKVTTLTQFMELLSKMGAHPIEAIATTNEGIGAGMVGAHRVVLIHGKISPQGGGSASSSSSSSQIDVTVKGSDAMMCSALAMYIQTMLR
jgi:Adaptin AP4 complex epsilon appendage platform